MKKLICEQDIQRLTQEGKTTCPIDKNTIITPSARDMAEKTGIQFQQCTAGESGGIPAELSGLTADTVLQLIQALISQGGLPADFCQRVLGETKPYQYEKDTTGLKVVRGGTVRMAEFFPGNPQIKYQELIDKNDSPISSGLLEIDHDSYHWVQNYDENDYVLEGRLTVTIDGRSYTAEKGDCVYIPKGSSVVMSSKNSSCKVFYNTFPSNWADLK